MTSNALLKLVWFLWAITILFAWWFIPPRFDDGIYLIPAISVLNNLPPGGIINESIQPIFYIFPTQSFLHGFFLKLLDFLSIEIGINTYRIFNYLSVFLLFYLIHRLFSVIFNNSVQRTGAINASLILLGLSQFSMQFFVNRPEILALVFFVIGLINSIKFITESKKSNLHITVALFSYGMSVILHANFIILSVFMIFYLIWLIIESHRMRYLKFVVIFFVPLSLFLIWILLNFDVAQDQLLSRVGQATNKSLLHFTSVIEMFSVVIGDSGRTFTHKVYLALHMFTLLVEILFLLFFFFLRNKANYRDNKIDNLFKILSLAILILLSSMESWPPNYLIIAFLAIISVVFFVVRLLFSKSNLMTWCYYIGSKLYFKPLVYFISTLFILSLPIFHSLKVYAYDGDYYNHHKARGKLDSILSGDEHIFISSAQLLPLYSDKINKDFSAVRNMKKENIHWYFPVHHSSPGPLSQELILQSITKDAILMQGAVWGASKLYFTFNENRNLACLALIGGKHYIKIKGIKVLHEDRDNLFILSESAKPSSKVLCYDLQKF
jgi:hypothetical protein